MSTGGNATTTGSFLCLDVLVAQWTARPTSNREDAGSTPAEDFSVPDARKTVAYQLVCLM